MLADPFMESSAAVGGIRVAVTGATGFVGSHVVAMLAGSGAEVVALDAGLGSRPIVAALAEAGKIEFVPAGPWPYHITQDLSDQLRRCDAIVHLGFSAVRTPSTANNVKREIELNLQGTVDLISALGSRCEHLCFASSAMVYPPTPGAHREQDAAPATPYGVAKLAAEQMAAVLGADRGLEVTTLRLSTVYGRWDTAPRAVPSFIRAVLERQPILLKGGSDVRDYVHVTDVARAVVAAIEARTPGVFNVGTGIPTRTDDLAGSISELADGRVPIHRLEDDRAANELVCSPALVRQVLGFETTVPLRQGLRDAFRWAADQHVGGSGPRAARAQRWKHELSPRSSIPRSDSLL